MTGQELIDLTRFLIHEAVEKFWDDDEIIMLLNMHLRQKSMWLSNSNAEYYWTELNYTITASSTSFALPNGTLYSSAPKVSPTGIEALFLNGSTAPLADADLRFFDVSLGEPTALTIRGNAILFDGTLSVGNTIKLQYWYTPNKITLANINDEVDFPEEYAGILSYESAIMCVIKDEGDITDLE